MPTGRRALLASILVLAAGAARAVSPPPPEVSGTVISADGRHLTLRDSAGETLDVTVEPEGRILVEGPLAGIDEIAEGRKVQTYARELPDGILRAMTSVVVVEQSRESAEGLIPWDHGELIVDGRVIGFAGVSPRRLLLSVKGELRQLEVGPGIDIVLLEDGDETTIRPGVTVRFYDLLAHPSGRYVARWITIDRESIAP